MFDRAAAVALIEGGICACKACPGDLTDAALSRGGWRFCRVCRCAWKVSAIDGQSYATAINSPAHAMHPSQGDVRQVNTQLYPVAQRGLDYKTDDLLGLIAKRLTPRREAQIQPAVMCRTNASGSASN